MTGEGRSAAGSAEKARRRQSSATGGRITKAQATRKSSRPSQKNTQTTATSWEAVVYRKMRMSEMQPRTSAHRSRKRPKPAPPAAAPAATRAMAAGPATRPMPTAMRHSDAATISAADAARIRPAALRGRRRRAASATAMEIRQNA